ncbi:MAG: tRNA (adenosine(37)-N6)-dimethylallyltransferase MiaA [Candidatus Improbicoccus pseudotrichonymphae]|uniref:tRNA dimethylallyltransferase n=1 Tax=Candidatus Improbicoccus pseudotrichonymphae TaxID=3033792 RepID=A0AA48KV57_9FIRM|nr:MAG: tRNA (adenosine(37)-N6)-dimethylallyltransferase MiaA [Candidatus Improbicoccus pseudotrichonymphae]
MNDNINGNLPLLIVILGPTAVGKTEMAFKLAQKLNTEIISADSMQVYKEINICNAKPNKQILNRVKHHLVDDISVTENYSVVKFTNKAKEIIKNLHNKNKPIIISGGTGLYINALLNNYQFEEKNIYEFEEEHYNKNLYQKLVKMDPESAKIINPNDKKRIIRALSFFNQFKKSITCQIKNTYENNQVNYRTIRIGLNFKDRQILYKKINDRVDLMIKKGLLQEVVDLKSNYKLSKTAEEAIGLKEIFSFLDKEIKFEEAIEKIKINTRRYSKRQITWFKRDNKIHWFYLDESKTEVIYKEILNLLTSQI